MRLLPGSAPLPALERGVVPLTALLVLLASPAAADAFVLSPAPGHRADGPVRVVVRADTHSVRATLNGRRVPLDVPRAGRRRAHASAAHGLRHGRNVLRVVRRAGPGSIERRTVVFFVRGRRPLAGAHDVRTHRGARVRLHAGPSRTRPGVTRRLRYRWRLVRAPRGSRMRARARRARAAGVAATPIVGTARTLSFTPDRLGTYEFALTADDGVASVGDRVTVDAGPTSAAVPVRTMARGKVNGRETWGTRVGDTFYPIPHPENPVLRFQVIALDRTTLAPLQGSNVSINCATIPECRDTVGKTLRSFGDGALVIVSAFPGQSYEQIDALEPIGYQPEPYAGDQGNLSVIGVVGMKPGQAWQRVKRGPIGDDGVPAGAMSGWLVLDQNGQFTFVHGDHPEYDTRASSPPGGNVMRIAGREYGASLPSRDDGGFHVVAMDRRTGQVVLNRAYRTTGRDAGIMTLASTLDGYGPDHLLFVTSINDPARLAVEAWRDWGRLAYEFQRMGGLAHTVNSMDENATYSIVGIPAGATVAGQWPETSSVLEPGAPGRLHGMLGRDHLSRFEPQTGDVNGRLTSPLHRVAFQPPTPWPDWGHGAPYAYFRIISGAIDAIPGKRFVDLRVAYWQADWSDVQWQRIVEAIEAQRNRYPEGSQFVNRDVWDRVIEGLQQEIGWLLAVRGYIDSLSKPFSDRGLRTWADLQQIAATVNSAIDEDGDPEEGAGVFAYFTLASLNDVFNTELPFGWAAFYAYRLADTLMRDAYGIEPEEDFEVTKGNLGSDLARRMELTQAAMGTLQRAIVSDYGKLKEVGSNAGCIPAQTGCRREWQFTVADRARAADLFSVATRTEIWRAFVRAKFTALDLQPDATGSIPTNAREYVCWVHAPPARPFQAKPLADEPDAAQQFFRSTRLPWTGYLWALIARKRGTVGTVKLPRQGALDPLFAPVSRGGLGLSKPRFFLQTFPPFQRGCRTFPYMAEV